MYSYICNSNIYAFDKGYITLPLKLTSLPKTITINEKQLFLKSSFHVSLICVKDMVIKHDTKIPDLEQNIVKAFCDFVSTNNVAFIQYKNEFRYAKNGEKETVVIMCDVSNIKKLFDYINELFGFHLETPPTHVTLYTLQPNVGIGLINASDIENKTRLITEQIPNNIKNMLT